MEVRLLGPVEVVVGGEVVDLGSGRPAQLLVALTLAPGHRLTVDELVDRCFGERADLDDPVPALRTAVRRLRRTLGDETIQTHRSGGGYELDLNDAVVDIDRFQELIASGRTVRDPVAARTSFRQALELWRGLPFGELSDHAWLDPERLRLEELHLVALEGWHAAHLRNGSATEIIPSLEAATSAHPLRERFRRQLMHALFLTDRQSEALRVFQEFRAELIEAGLEPSAETVALEQRIASGDPSLREANAARDLRGYRIEERLGEGAFSIVYRGTQPAVDRPVAIKQIRAELANRPEFIRRFETEAHLVARLEHPFIVPLYDYWREPDSAYLVMRYLRGGNLETRLYDGRWDLDKTVAMVHQVGDALATAHRAGVVHRDVKPANILLDDDDNAYLADFGIALDASEAADPAAALSAGSPAYASPEQLQRLPVGPPADVHGLAIATYEALTGHVPFPDEPNQAAMLQRQLHDPIPQVRDSRSDIPTGIDAVLAKATAKSPVDRYQSVEEFVAALDEAAAEGNASVVVASSHRTMVGAEARNPYKGLRAFDEADAADFTGRDRLIDQLVEALDRSRLVAVVGPSGSGKSSVVRAGLLPALRAGRVPGSARWFITRMMPSANPFEEMERALLRIASVRPPDLLSVLTSGERGIARAVHHTIPESDDQVLLVIDQFEELFTLADPARTKTFLKALAIAVTDERSRLRVVLTLRADFYDRPLRYEGIGGLVKDATVAVLPLAPDELERAIVDPAHAVGAEFEPGLVAEIAADVVDQPGALPLLQYALTELYEAEVSGLMTRDAYRKLGGVAGALGRRAEKLYLEADSAEQTAIRRIFGRLVSLGEGTEDTRRRALGSELGDETATAAVVDRYGTARLLSFDRDPATREPTVEVAHEALLREWPRLRGWLDEDRDGLRILRHIHTTAHEWEAAGRPESELYRGGRLEAAEEWAEEHPDELTEGEQGFLAASIDRRKAQQIAEQQTKRRLQRLLTGVGAIAVIAVIAGAFAFQQRSRAEDQAELAQQNADVAQEARASSETLRVGWEGVSRSASDRQLGLLLAAEAYQRDPSAETLGFLQRTISSTDGFLGYFGTDRSYLAGRWIVDVGLVAIHPGGIDIYDSELSDRSEISLDIHSRRSLGTMDGTRLPITPIAASSEGDLVAVATASQVLLIDIRSRSIVGEFLIDGDADDVAMSPDGSRLAATTNTGDLFVIDIASGDVRSVAAHPEEFMGELDYPDDLGGQDFIPTVLAFLPMQDFPVNVTFLDDGSVVTVNGHHIKRWDAASVEQLGDDMFIRNPNNNPFGFFPLSSLGIAAGPTPGTLRMFNHSSHGLLDVTSGETLETFTASDVAGVARSPRIISMWPVDDGRYVATINNGELRLLDSAGVDLVEPRLTGLSSAASSAVDPTTGRVAVFGPEGAALYSLRGEQLLADALPRNDRDGAAISGDGIRVSVLDHTFQMDDPAELWDLSGDDPVRLEKPGANDIGPSGRPWIWFFGRSVIRDPKLADGPIDVYDASTFELLASEIPTTGQWSGNVVSDDQSLMAVGRGDGVLIWNLRTGRQEALLDVGVSAPSLSFDPEVERLAVARENRVTIWALDSYTQVAELEGMAVRFSRSGTYLGVWLADGTIELRDGTSLEVVASLDGPVGVGSEQYPGVFTNDDRYLLSLAEGAPRLWDLESLAQVGDPFPNDRGFRLSGADGDVLQAVTAVDDHVLLWNLDVSRWFDLACRAAGRNLTIAEWEQFGPADEPYQATCSQWPSG